MENETLINVFTKITAGYVLFVIIASCILNPIILYTCIRSKKLRSISTFKLIAISSINDLICNLWWNQEAFTNTFFDFRSFNRSLFYCRVISVFLQFTSFQLASWLLVSISLDRFLSMIWKKWSKKWFSGAKPIIFSLILAAVIIGINLNEVITAGYSYDENGTEIIICYDNPDNEYQWYETMSQVNLYFGYIAPYGLMIILNSLIIYKATQFQRAQKATATTTSAANSRSIRRKAEMTRTVYTITIFYIVTTLPSIIVAGYFYLSIVVLSTGQMIINLINAFQSTYQAYNFVILFFSNKLFAKEFKSSFRCLNTQVWPSSVSNRSKTNQSVVHPNSQRRQTIKTQNIKK